MNWGQRTFWTIEKCSSGTPRHGVTVDIKLGVPAGTALPLVNGALNALVRRHESLRTTYRLDEPTQLVHEPRPMEPELIRAADASAAAEAARDLVSRPTGLRFELDREFPVRATIILVDSIPFSVHLCCHHIAVDAISEDILRDEFAQLLGALSKGQAPRLPPITSQPVDLARYEQSDRGRKANEAAIRYLDHQYSTMQNRMFPAASTSQRLHQVTISSATLETAARRLARRLRVTESTVLFTAVASLLGRLGGFEQYAMMTIASNRFRTETRAMVGCLIQPATVAIDLSGDPSFAALVKRIYMASITAHRYGRFDIVAMMTHFKECAASRGICFSPLPYFNYTSLASAPGSDAGALTFPEVSQQAETVISSSSIDHATDPGGRDNFSMDAYCDGDSTMIKFIYNATMVPPDIVITLAQDIETMLSTAADDPSPPLSAMLSLCGTDLMKHESGWVKVMNCWVDLSAVQDVLCKHPDIAAASAAVERDAEGNSMLVVYIVASDAKPTTASLHRFFLDSLPTNPCAIAPHRYEFVAELPARVSLTQMSKNSAQP